jgi:hypothetical protein
MNPLLEKIHALLGSEQDELARACEEILKSGSPGLQSFDLPLKNTRDIYYRRAGLNADRGHPIKGFERLVENLKKETVPQVGIQSVAVGPRQFMLFTTPDVSRLIGILVFPAGSQSAVPRE